MASDGEKALFYLVAQHFKTEEKKMLKILKKNCSFCYFSNVLALGAIIFLLIPSDAFATASTHIWAPSTDVQPYLKWHLTADFYMPTESNSDGTRPNTITNAGLTVGILPFKKLNAEIGFDHKTGYGDLDKYPMYFNAKVGIPEGSYGKFFPAIAVGVYDIGTESDKTNFDVVYGKVAKSFSFKGFDLGRFSAGYFSGNSKLLVHGSKKDNDGALIAWERTMKEISDKLWVCVEYQGSRSSYGTLNLGFSWKFADNVAVLVGYDIANDPDLANTVSIQTDIDF